MLTHQKVWRIAVGGLCLLWLIGCASESCQRSQLPRPPRLIPTTWPGPYAYWLDGLHLVISPNVEASIQFGDGTSEAVISGDQAKIYAILWSVTMAANRGKDEETSSAPNYLNQFAMRISIVLRCVPVVCERVQYEREKGGTEALNAARKWLKNGFVTVSSSPDKPEVGERVSLSQSQLAQIRRALGE